MEQVEKSYPKRRKNFVAETYDFLQKKAGLSDAINNNHWVAKSISRVT